MAFPRTIKFILLGILVVFALLVILGFFLGVFRATVFSEPDITRQPPVIFEDLVINDTQLSFVKTTINIDKGGSDVLTVGVRNKLDADLCYTMEFEAIQDDAGELFDADDWFQYAPGPQDSCHTIAPADSLVKYIRLKLPKDVGVGTYFIQFRVIDNNAALSDPIYDTTDISVIVTE